MKPRLPAGVALVAFLLCAKCSLFHFKPVDALAGTEAGYLLSTAALQGWFTGGNLYSGVKPVRLDLADNETLSSNTALIYDLTPGFAGIESGRFYRRSAVNACQEEVFVTSLILTFALFDGGPAVPGNDVIFASAVASAATAANCENLEAGEYVDFTPLPLAF